MESIDPNAPRRPGQGNELDRAAGERATDVPEDARTNDATNASAPRNVAKTLGLANDETDLQHDDELARPPEDRSPLT